MRKITKYQNPTPSRKATRTLHTKVLPLAKQPLLYVLLILLSILFLTSCTGMWEKDNTPEPSPLVTFKQEIQPKLLWSTQAGSGVGDEYLKAGPALSESAIYTTSTNGNVSALNKATGAHIWQINTNAPLTSGAGIGEGLVVVGSHQGDVIALRQSNGKMQWKVNVSGEILATPAIADGRVIIKSIDGYVRALSTQDGRELWSYQQAEPNLILRASSAPLTADNHVFVGFANGNLTKFKLTSGQLQWIRPIAVAEGAFSIQRMIDIDANPVIVDHHVYAATYQGKIAALDWTSGEERWSRDISSYTGMAANQQTVYISDAKSHVYAFDAQNGQTLWHQNKLESRVISGPALMGNYVVVGDAQGYLHWLNQQDGHFSARIKLGSAIYAAPVYQHGVLYVLTSKGNLSAYTLTP